jgi:serine/threonine protein kinase
MRPTSVESFCNLLHRSRLLAGAAIRVARQRWLAEAGPAAGDVARFAKWLVGSHFVTEYQAGLLLRGRGDRIFLNEYKLTDRIAAGRMAGVYKAVDPRGQVVAIKVLPPSRAKEPQALARFHREARLALRCNHPHVVRTFQQGEADGLHYIVMEYLVGETLETTLERRGKLPPAEAVRLIYQALQGLQCLHEEGVIHRDIKPANLMLVPGFNPGRPDTTLHATVKILDVGLGRALFDEGLPPLLSPGEGVCKVLGTGAKDVDLTASGEVIGTPDYMAPEQALNASGVDVRADIYSLGCVFYHALAGQPPFRTATLIQQLLRPTSEPARRLRDLNVTVPDELQYVIDTMMAKDPALRYPTPERAARALKPFLMENPGK